MYVANTEYTSMLKTLFQVSSHEIMGNLKPSQLV